MHRSSRVLHRGVEHPSAPNPLPEIHHNIKKKFPSDACFRYRVETTREPCLQSDLTAPCNSAGISAILSMFSLVLAHTHQGHGRWYTGSAARTWTRTEEELVLMSHEVGKQTLLYIIVRAVNPSSIA